MTTVTLPREVVRKALLRAYSLGQKYWQQADSESYKQNAKADITDATFRQLIVDTCAALDAPQAVPEGWQRVPIEPTPEMIKAGEVASYTATTHREWIPTYKAMLAAAPTPKEQTK